LVAEITRSEKKSEKCSQIKKRQKRVFSSNNQNFSNVWNNYAKEAFTECQGLENNAQEAAYRES